MSDNSQAEAAIKGLNGTELLSRAISVNESRPKPEGERRGGGRQGGGRPGGGRQGGGRQGGGQGGGRPRY